MRLAHVSALVLAAAVAACGGRSDAPSIEIVSAKALTGASRGVVEIHVRTENWTPHSRYEAGWHIFVDGRFNNPGSTHEWGATHVLPAGDHRIYVELMTEEHTPHDPPIRSETVTVRVP